MKGIPAYLRPGMEGVHVTACPRVFSGRKPKAFRLHLPRHLPSGNW